MISRDNLFIDGRWVSPSGAGTISVISPATEQVVGTVPDGTPADIDRAVAAARSSFDAGDWRTTSPAARADLLTAAAELMEQRGEDLAAMITEEMGSTITFSRRAQVPTPLGFLRFYADLIRSYCFDDHRSAGGTSVVTKEPVGVVGAIAPWNVPLLTTMSKVAPALAAGCSVVVKPAPESPFNCFFMAEAFAEVGLPDGVLNVVPAGREAGEALVRHPGVDKIAFTGSTAAGKRIAGICGEQLKRVSLELGGKSAAIVLDDVSIEDMLARLIPMSFMNSGQACVAQSRILVPRRRSTEIQDALVEAVAALRIGAPEDPDTDVGPLVADRQRERVEGFIESGRAEGARVVLGGGRPASMSRGWYVEPTIFAGVHNDMRIAREEIFGPVVSMIEYDDPDEAVAIANDSDFGLSGSVWTADEDQGLDIARRVRTGMVSVNGAPQAAFTPFGGFKQSGIGREFGPEAFEMYLETKSIAVPAR